MTRKNRLPILATSILAAVALPALAPFASAANYFWDPTQLGTDPGSGGTADWNTTSSFWHLAGVAGDVVWPNVKSNTATFAGTAGTVTVTTPTMRWG